MNTRSLVDPDLLPGLDAYPVVHLNTAVLPTLRGSERLTRLPFDIDERIERAVDVSVRVVPGPPGAPNVALAIYRAREAAPPLPCIYHMHGGGFVAGSVGQSAPLHKVMAYELCCAIVSVEYRLAPETPYPGAIEDCYAGLDWLFENAAALGVDAARIGVMGESAGGGLAACLALLTRDRGRRRLAFQHLIYPMLDDRTCIAGSPNPVAGEYIWTRESNRFGWRALLGCEPGGVDVSPYAAAARARDLSSLPHAFIACPTLDLFIDEGIDYAQRLMRARVPVELHVYPGGFHGFDMIGGDAPIAVRARRDSWDALRRFMRLPQTGGA